jgi:hypothetical protein
MKGKYYYSFDFNITIGEKSDSFEEIGTIIRRSIRGERPPTPKDLLDLLINVYESDPPYYGNPIYGYTEKAVRKFLNEQLELTFFSFRHYRESAGSLHIYFEIAIATFATFESVMGSIDLLSHRLENDFVILSGKRVDIRFTPKCTKIRIGKKKKPLFKKVFSKKATRVLASYLLLILCILSSTYLVLYARKTDEADEKKRMIEFIREYERAKSQQSDSTVVVAN